MTAVTIRSMAATTHDGGGGIEMVLHRLKSTEPPLYLSPSPDLSQSARSASQYLFSLLRPFTPKSPFSTLLTQGFDTEQIWQQIDLQSQPLISGLRREVKNFDKNPEEIRKLFDFEKNEGLGFEGEIVGAEERENEGLSLEGFDEEELEGFDEEEDGGSEEERENEEEGESEEEGGAGDGVEDQFLKIKELEEYLEDDEAREYGLENKKKYKNKKGNNKIVDDDEEDDEDEHEEEEEEDEEDDELGVLGIDDGEDDEGEEFGNIRYDDFFGGKKKSGQKKKSKQIDKHDDSDTGDEQSDDMGHDDNQFFFEQKEKNLSTFQKYSEKQRSKIKEMEKANLEPKTWTMHGEVTAAKRPKNSALEVELDFEHNIRPAPTITEEVTANIEQLIQKRILEGRFDDVQRAPTLPSKALKEIKELDENKSKKGLAEIYADEYVQKTGLVSAALTFSNEQKKEATMLFRKLCLKLDALSHLHFTPKPVIEDMSIQANVPALAMEEIAPLVISDAAMLAPEEVFAGKGDIKEEAELTQAERKRRRANKKRKFKAEASRRTAKKPRESTLENHDGKDEL